MKEVSKILFPTDFSLTAENAWRYCLMLADRYAAKILITHVVYPEYEMMDLPTVAARATRDKIEAVRSTLLPGFVERGLAQVQAANLLKTVPEIFQEVEVGAPVESITRLAKNEEADLIVMGTNGEHNVLEKVFGSVAAGVISHAHCPVWVVPQQAEVREIHSVVYASDLRDADPLQIWRAGKMLEPFAFTLHCVHVQTGDSIEEAMDFAFLGSFFENKSPALQIQFQSLTGKDIPTELETFSNQHNADLIIMYGPHYPFLERLFHKSQTKKMAMTTTHPLLVLK